ncbi:MAG: hypothetical protein ACM336_15225 [Acidobacteriota bacterium]
MELDTGKTYRAKAATGEMIRFKLDHMTAAGWAVADLEFEEEVESGVMLNTNLLLWISSEAHAPGAFEDAAADVIEALEKEEI